MLRRAYFLGTRHNRYHIADVGKLWRALSGARYFFDQSKRRTGADTSASQPSTAPSRPEATQPGIRIPSASASGASEIEALAATAVPMTPAIATARNEGLSMTHQP